MLINDKGDEETGVELQLLASAGGCGSKSAVEYPWMRTEKKIAAAADIVCTPMTTDARLKPCLTAADTLTQTPAGLTILTHC